MVLSTAKNKQARRRRRTRSSKLRNGKRGGFGFWFKQEPVTNIEKENYNESSCPDTKVPCDVLDTHYKNKKNEMWKTCIKMNGINNHIIYVTQSNVLIKSIESGQIPVFQVSFFSKAHPLSPPINCNIMIEDRFISCFLYICGQWYAMMRMFGNKTFVNTGFLAQTEKNRAFYKLKGIIVDFETGVVKIPHGAFSEISDKKFLLVTEKSKIINIKDGYFTNIDKQNSPKVFDVMQSFRQQKLLGNEIKNEAEFQAVDGVLGWVF